MISALLLGMLVLTAPAVHAAAPAARAAVARVSKLARLPGARPRNVVFILADDHRFDAMGFLGHPWLRTPNMDAMRRAGAHLENAFVTTSLCSPSRASILTGVYTHRHGVVDNGHNVREGTVFFPQYLQKAGYQTGFFGKWHMGGHHDDPRPGFDRWVSFKGQGEYYPVADGLNVDGQRVPQKGYISDELTDYALDWLRGRKKGKPFFVYLSHKGVHADFKPAERHAGTYKGKEMLKPSTLQSTPESLRGRPRWVQDQRNSWHGVDYPYHSALDIEEYYRRYAETLLGIDDSIGRVIQYLKDEGLFESTLVIYMGDNGFAFGEHGLIDKRTAYEESMRVPMLAQCPEVFAGGSTVSEMVANIDVAPTVLDAAGLRAPAGMDGRSFLPLLRGQKVPWRDTLLYEYYWERNFPQTPTVFALRGDRYKYIRVHGLWDIDELYDLKADPAESRNLIFSPAHKELVAEMNRRLWRTLEETGGMNIPLLNDTGRQNNRRRRSGFRPGAFSDDLIDAQ